MTREPTLCLVCGEDSPCPSPEECNRQLQEYELALQNDIDSDINRILEKRAKPAHVFTVKTDSGSEKVTVEVGSEEGDEDETLSDGPRATDTESDLATQVVMDIGEITQVDLDICGDLLQDLMEDAIVATREAVLDIVRRYCPPNEYEKISFIIREIG
jgi:hypothetical protein